MSGPNGGDERTERRTFLLAGAALLGALLALIAFVALVAGGEGDERTPTGTTIACAEDDAACLATQRAGERPGIIPRPGEGQAPDAAGEPGGWQQLTVLGAIVAGLGLIVALVVRSVRRTDAPRTG